MFGVSPPLQARCVAPLSAEGACVDLDTPARDM